MPSKISSSRCGEARFLGIAKIFLVDYSFAGQRTNGTIICSNESSKFSSLRAFARMLTGARFGFLSYEIYIICGYMYSPVGASKNN